MTTNSVKAVPAGVLIDARGIPIPMGAGPCLWCARWVTSQRDEAGATGPYDPCWAADGDFGCDLSPESNEEGCGDHARPYDLALRLMRGD